MSRLDRHIALVQGKLGLGRFLSALAYTVLIFVGLVWVVVVIGRVFQIYPPRPIAFFWGGVGAAVLGAMIWSLFHKPTDIAAAVAIDQVLGLKEKFSTALIYRSSSDPFAAAAVKDAEHAAENVSLHKRFPLPFPTMAYWTIAATAVLLLTVWLFPKNLDLLGKEAERKQRMVEQQKRDDVRHTAERALATVNSYPKAMQNATAVQLAKKDLENLLNQPINDPAQANRTAFKALEQANEAIKEEIKNSDQFARAQSDQKMLRSLNPTPDEQGPVADAQRDISKGDFAKAIENLNAAADKFDKMSDEEKQKTAQQMANMAAQLQQMAQNPAMQKQLQQQIQQMTGATPAQAQQLQQAIQQAAQGNPQAQQQLQQMQQKMMQNATPQQQAQMQAMMKQMQAQAQSQATAQQMQQAAQQMAQAMQQAAAGQPGGQQGQQKQGQGQKGGQQGGQMAAAQQQMQQALGQMDAIQKDAQQMAAAADATGAAANDAASKVGSGDQGQQGGGKGGAGARGNWQAGVPNNQQGKWNGRAGEWGRWGRECGRGSVWNQKGDGSIAEQ